MPPVGGRDERQRLHQVRSISQQDPAFPQGLIHQRNLPAGQIADTTMHQLRRAARGRLREVSGLHQGGAVAPGRGVHGDTKARRSATHNQHIEVICQQFEFLFPAFQSFPLETSKSRPQVLPEEKTRGRLSGSTATT